MRGKAQAEAKELPSPAITRLLGCHQSVLNFVLSRRIVSTMLHLPQARQNRRKYRPLQRLGAIVGCCVALVSVPQAWAQEVSAERQYQECLDFALREPEPAFERASTWRDMGGGLPARHCVAVALFGLGNYDEAATRLEKLSGHRDAKDEALRAALLGQAGNAWMMAGKMERAHAALSAGLEIMPDNVDLLIDRSLVLAAAQNYWETVDDLNEALNIEPDQVDALVFRAAAYRYLDTLELAAEDVDRALAIAPGHISGLLERGNIRRLKGDIEGARADWLQIVTREPDSPAAEAARRNLERLDIATE